MSDTPEAVAPLPTDPAGQSVNPQADEPLDPASLAAHYEQDDVNVGALARFGLGIAVASVVALGVLWFAMRAWTGQPLLPSPQMKPAAVEPPAVSGPGLDAAPEETLDAIRAREAVRLTTYGWVDREHGVVRIPIDEAMRRMVEQGVPARAGPAPNFGLGDAFRMDSTGGTVPVGSTTRHAPDMPAGAEGGEGDSNVDSADEEAVEDE